MLATFFRKLTTFQIALFTFSLLVTAFFAVGIYRTKQNDEYDLVYQNAKKQKQAKSATVSLPEQFHVGLEKDSNVRYAERLREASALMVGLSVSEYYDRLSNKRIDNLNLAQVLESAKEKALLPDIFTMRQIDQAVTTNGLYYIRYSAKPFALEIVSVGGNGYADGEVFVLRLPDAGMVESKKGDPQNAWASLWISPNAETALPKPFASENDYLNAGWKKESLRIGDVQIP